jgi:heterodisulfide reductase subunit C
MEEEVKTCDNCEACAGGCTMHEGTEAPSTEEAAA